MKKKGLVKDSELIREALAQRKKDLGLSLINICNDAERLGMKILHPSLSRYFNKSKINNLSEEAILFLCARYDVPVELIVGTPSTYVTYSIHPYSAHSAMSELFTKFPKNYAKVHKRRSK